jgi:adenine-specific DNA-methyltransferase
MDKLKMQTPDLTDKNIERLASLFPNVITETKDENGTLKKVVDFDLLKTALSKDIVEGDDERYRLDWPGKKASLLKANMPITKTLRPCREESVNFGATGNLYIEGDNFEVLKILQESYLGKVKMIYIDPPYNTGNDFIYKDDFMRNKDEYDEDIGAVDEDGNKMFKENTKTNPRYHSDWLSMMHERVIVARDLLTDDGVFFVSIDDNEVHNLRKICDEIFGEENFVAQIIVKSNPGGRDYGGIALTHDYVVVYTKGGENELNLTEEVNKNFQYSDNIGNFDARELRNRNIKFNDNNRPNLCYPFFVDPNDIDENELYKVSLEEQKGFIKVMPLMSQGIQTVWRWGKPKVLENININVKAKKKNDGTFMIIEKYRSNLKRERSIFDETDVRNERGSLAIKEVFDNSKPFDYPKSDYLIKKLIRLGAGKDDLVLDFFSGSATTAHAVMQLNAEDGGNRKFIMVQLPEKTDENSEAHKAGYKTIADIGKERIRRAGKKIVEELKSKTQQLKLGEDPVDASKLDIGFRVYKTDDTNMKDVFYHPAELNQKKLAFLESNIKEDRTPEDLLTQVILDLGLELSLPIETKKIGKNTVFIVQTNALLACFDNDIDFKIVDSIADLKPFKVVFKDASFKNDKDRINVEERFKRLSPETKVTVI